MEDEPIKRRLTAILAADVVGYGRLMEANEERALAALRHHRRDFFDPTVTKHGGRLFKVMGDGFLVEFSSVTSAVKCAVEIQRGMPGRNIGVPEDRQIKFRIGINVGDLVVEGDDFLGDGVILATRLEGLAKPGGIACSASARSQIGNNLDLNFADQGEITVKNASQPVHVFFVELNEGSPDAAAGSQADAKSVALQDIPSVAVLPFANVSNDPDQEYFSDGITEDIIADLSKVSGLSVLSRNTVFTLKGKALNLEETAKKLGVAYLVEGSVRKAGNRVRITVQLIQGATDRPIWAERYDRDLTDIFEVQDEITHAVVDQLRVTLLPEEKKEIEQEQTVSAEAYNAYLRGVDCARTLTKASLLRAQQFFREAIEIDPQYARAYLGLANCASWLRMYHGADFSFAEIYEITEKALQIDSTLSDAFTARGVALGMENRSDGAVAAFERALSLDSNSYEAHFHLGLHLTVFGELSEAAEHFTRATEIRPDDYEAPIKLGKSYLSLNRRDLMESYLKIGIGRAEAAFLRHPENSRPAQLLGPAYAQLGDGKKARFWTERAIDAEPDDNILRYNAACTYAQIGEVDRAFELLFIWIGQAAHNMQQWFQTDPDLASLRSDPRYQKLLDQANS